MRNDWRYQPRPVANYPTDSGADDSRILHGSHSASCAADQSRGLELPFDPPDNLSYAFASETLNDEKLGK